MTYSEEYIIGTGRPLPLLHFEGLVDAAFEAHMWSINIDQYIPFSVSLPQEGHRKGLRCRNSRLGLFPIYGDLDR